MKTSAPACRDPWLAALLSVLVPGLGQGYCGRWMTGISFFLLATGFAVIGVAASLGHVGWMVSLGSAGTIFYFANIVDAYFSTARRARLGGPGDSPLPPWGPAWLLGFAVSLFLFAFSALVIFVLANRP